MEPVKAEMNFPRQAETITITMTGAVEDVNYWMAQLMRKAEFKGDVAHKISEHVFKIYPRAVND